MNSRLEYEKEVEGLDIAQVKLEGACISETDYFIAYGHCPKKGSAQYKEMEQEKKMIKKIGEMNLVEIKSWLQHPKLYGSGHICYYLFQRGRDLGMSFEELDKYRDEIRKRNFAPYSNCSLSTKDILKGNADVNIS
jgi:hypothetical protein